MKLPIFFRFRRQKSKKIDINEDPYDIPYTKLDDTDDLYRYPPFAKGFPLLNIKKMLDDQHSIIYQLKSSLPIDAEEYERLFLPILKQYAGFVHLLPASEAHHHRGSGGLFRHGLEVAYFASHSARTKNHTGLAINVAPKHRNLIKQKWHVACVVAALLHDVGKPVSDIVVSGTSNTEEPSVLTWDQEQTLVKWAYHNNIHRYFISWVPNRHQKHHSVTDMASRLIITSELRSWLREFNDEIIQDINHVLTNPYDTSVLMAQIVLSSDAKSVELDTKITSKIPVFGVPIHEFLLDTMRALVSNGEWKINKPEGKLWVFEDYDGVFLSWYEAAKDIVSYMKDAKLPMIYQNPDSLASVLLTHNLAIYCNVPDNDEDEEGDIVNEETGEIFSTSKLPLNEKQKHSREYMYWQVEPMCLQGAVIYMLRLKHFNLIDSKDPPIPIPAFFRNIETDSSQKEGNESIQNQKSDSVNSYSNKSQPSKSGRPDETESQEEDNQDDPFSLDIDDKKPVAKSQPSKSDRLDETESQEEDNQDDPFSLHIDDKKPAAKSQSSKSDRPDESESREEDNQDDPSDNNPFDAYDEFDDDEPPSCNKKITSDNQPDTTNLPIDLDSSPPVSVSDSILALSEIESKLTKVSKNKKDNSFDETGFSFDENGVIVFSNGNKMPDQDKSDKSDNHDSKLSQQSDSSSKSNSKKRTDNLVVEKNSPTQKDNRSKVTPTKDDVSASMDFFKNIPDLGGFVVSLIKKNSAFIVIEGKCSGFLLYKDAPDDYLQFISKLTKSDFLDINPLTPLVQTKKMQGGKGVYYPVTSDFSNHLKVLHRYFCNDAPPVDRSSLYAKTVKSSNSKQNKPNQPKNRNQNNKDTNPKSENSNNKSNRKISSEGLVEPNHQINVVSVPKGDPEKIRQTNEMLEREGVFTANQKAKDRIKNRSRADKSDQNDPKKIARQRTNESFFTGNSEYKDEDKSNIQKNTSYDNEIAEKISKQIKGFINDPSAFDFQISKTEEGWAISHLSVNFIASKLNLDAFVVMEYITRNPLYIKKRTNKLFFRNVIPYQYAQK